MNVIHLRPDLYIYPMRYESLVDQLNNLDTAEEMDRLIKGANPCKLLTNGYAQILGGDHCTRSDLVRLFIQIMPEFDPERDVYFVSTDPPEEYWEIKIDLT